jgi:hypothetical protein
MHLWYLQRYAISIFTVDCSIYLISTLIWTADLQLLAGTHWFELQIYSYLPGHTDFGSGLFRFADVDTNFDYLFLRLK